MAELFAITKNLKNVSSHIIFIHGLNGDPFDTWQSPLLPKECWLRWLDEDFEDLAVWTVGYEASISRWRGSAMHFTDRARNILERILAEPRLKTGVITFVGHSLGGLEIKQLFRAADGMSHHRDDVAEFISRVRKVAFLATPHSGSGLATLGDRFRVFVKPSAATSSLVRNDPNLRDLNIWYRNWAEKVGIDHLILTESKPIRIAGMIVEPDSSDPGLSTAPIMIDAGHFTICKPKDRSSEIYLLIKNFVEREVSSKRIENVELDALEKKLDDYFKNPVSQLPQKLIDKEIKLQLSTIRKSRFVVGIPLSESVIQLAEKIKHGEFNSGSSEIKSEALAWCARLLSVGELKDKSKELLEIAKKLGSGPEIAIAEAFIISANDKLEDALNNLAGISSAEARSAAFIIMSHKKGAASAIEWLSKSGISFADLDPDGKLVFIMKQFELLQWDSALENCNNLQEIDYDDAPILLYMVGIANLIKTVPDELKTVVLGQIPFESKNFPLSSKEDSIIARRKAKEYLQRYSKAATELNCIDAANIADDYSLWLELRDPENYESGLQKLQGSLRDKKHSLRRVHLALSFGIKLDIDAVEDEIEKRIALTGGKSLDAALARFALVFSQKTPNDMAKYIDNHRAQLQKYFGEQAINALEIEVLSKAGLFQQAEVVLDVLIKGGISEEEEAELREKINETIVNDPIEASKKQYDKSNKLNDLINLVGLLEEKGEWSSLCHYAYVLFQNTGSVSDAKILTNALYKEDRYSEIVDFLGEYPEILEHSSDLQMLWSWALFYEGKFDESKKALNRLRNINNRDHPNDRALAVQLAIYSGDWEALNTCIEDEWIKRDYRDANELIAVAQLAQVVGSPRTKDLIEVSVSKGNNDVKILTTAYFLSSSSGWENDEIVGEWLNKAAELSGESGLIKKVDLKEVIDKQPEWQRRENETFEKLDNGEIFVCVAAHLVNRTLTDLFLLPILANRVEPDPRKRLLVHAYSGNRNLVKCDYNDVAIDSTALITLGTLNLLDTVNSAFENVVIPHSTLSWLFEEKQKVSFHQPSMIKLANELRQLIVEGELKEFIGAGQINYDLVNEVGDDIAKLLSAVINDDFEKDRQKVAVLSSPVHRVDSLMEEEADLSLYYNNICSCLTIVEKLKKKGVITTAQESKAVSYLKLHEKDWPEQPELSDNAILYLDDISVSYLQHVELIDKLRLAGLEAYISSSKIEEINSLLHYENLTVKAENVLDKIKKYLAVGIQSGKIRVGHKTRFNNSVKETIDNHPTLSIYDLAKDVDAVIVDDRFVNQYANIDSGGKLTPVITTLDIIEEIYSKRYIDVEKLLDIRTELRRSGYLFVPVTSEELKHCLSMTSVNEGVLLETAEIRAIRENITRIRMTNALQLPKEANWINNLRQTLTQVLKEQWNASTECEVSSARSDWLFKLLDIRGWGHSLVQDKNPGELERSYGILAMTLVIAPQNITNEKIKEYHSWVDNTLLNTIKEKYPDTYSWIINRTKELISKYSKSLLDTDAN